MSTVIHSHPICFPDGLKMTFNEHSGFFVTGLKMSKLGGGGEDVKNPGLPAGGHGAKEAEASEAPLARQAESRARMSFLKPPPHPHRR